MKKVTMGIAFLWLFLFSTNSVSAGANIPQQVGDIYVQDFANIIEPNTEAEIIKLGKALDQKTKAQIAIMTVPSTGGLPIEEYALESFRTYQLGDKEENNGILLIISQDPKEVRIEVGYGLEGVINDGKAGTILDTITIPRLQEGKLSLAMYETYSKLVNEVQHYYDTGSVSEGDSGESKFSLGMVILIIIILVIAIILDIYIFGGLMTHIVLSLLSSAASVVTGGGGDSGGGGSSRDW